MPLRERDMTVMEQGVRSSHFRLSELTAGRAAEVLSVSGDRELRRRLLEMGFCNGARVELVRRAPLGDPIEFRLRGYLLSLRNEQAQHVLVKTIR